MTVNDLGLVTVAEAADIAGVAPRTVRTWMRRYRIEPVWQGELMLLSERAVLEVESATRREPRGRPRDS